tara:strand:- start:27594 stop:28241 length:648 start_codon:yes stop_codon:yes gene_type:complete
MLFEKDNILFIHIPKNAGSSIEKLFVSRGNTTETELIDDLKQFSKYTILAWEYFPSFINVFEKIIYTYHSTVSNYIMNKSKSYNIFTIIRHPQDRIVSFYIYFGIDTLMTFYQFLLKLWNNDDTLSKFIKKNQIDYLFNNSNINIDIINYDTLEEDWKALCTKYNIEYTKLKNINTSDDHDKKCFYSGENKNKILELVYDIYKADFEAFNFKLKY